MMKLFETEKFDAVCNLAAQAGVRYSLTNPDAYMDRIYEACRHNNLSVYGLNEELPFSTM